MPKPAGRCLRVAQRRSGSRACSWPTKTESSLESIRVRRCGQRIPLNSGKNCASNKLMSCGMVDVQGSYTAKSLPLILSWHRSSYGHLRKENVNYDQNVGPDHRNHTQPQTPLPKSRRPPGQSTETSVRASEDQGIHSPE